MHRAIFLASLCAVGVMSAHAAELCVACQEPAATYRCTVEQPSDKYSLGTDLETQICSKVLAQKGAHKNCALVPVAEGGKCEGLERTVTVTDYQRALGARGESTYEVGAFEIARRNVYDTWLCVSSMFKDC
jgi:hypothetical protein